MRALLSIGTVVRCAGPCHATYGHEHIEVDHVIPLSQGGTDTAGNLQLLCGPCHRAKTVAEGAIA